MLAIAYRNIVDMPTGINSVTNAGDFGRPDRRLIRRMQRNATNALLGDLLEREAGYSASSWRLIETSHGKPALVTADEPSAIEVSLSHSRSLAAAAITDLGVIGVDIEYRSQRRSSFEIAEYAFGPHEQSIVRSGRLADFYRIWTLREALAKALGIGFPMLADGRDYFAAAPNSGIWQSTIDGRRWLFCIAELPNDYAIGIAFAPSLSSPAIRPADLTIRKFDQAPRINPELTLPAERRFP